MNEKPKGFKGRGNRHNNRRQKQRQEPSLQPLVWNPQPCILCGKIINEMASAIAQGKEGQAAHMECVIQDLEAKEGLGSGERITYIGAGSFAVIKDQEGGPEILRKIPVESKDVLPEWRRDIRNQISKSP